MYKRAPARLYDESVRGLTLYLGAIKPYLICSKRSGLVLDGETHQRRMLLRTIDVALTEIARRNGADDGTLDRLSRVEVDNLDNVVRLDVIEITESLLGDRLSSLHLIVYIEVLEDDIEGDLIGTRVLAPDDGGYIH